MKTTWRIVAAGAAICSVVLTWELCTCSRKEPLPFHLMFLAGFLFMQASLRCFIEASGGIFVIVNDGAFTEAELDAIRRKEAKP